jgi:4-hydroxyproline epimerase
VGIVSATLHENGEVSVENVPSYRKAADVEIELGDLPAVRGDVAWGGNWFFLTGVPSEQLTLLEDLLEFSRTIRCAVNAHGIPRGRPHRTRR